MKLKIYQLNVVFFILLFMQSCNSIHVFPDGETPVKMMDVDIKLFCNVKPMTEDMSRAVDNDQVLRAVIEIYKADNMENIVHKREIVLDITDPSALNRVEKFQLEDAKYRFLVWMDYVKQNDKKDQHYITKSSLRHISFIEPFISNTDNRDCFSGAAYSDITLNSSKQSTHIEIPIELTRPVAKYMLVATDVNEFIIRSKTKGETRTEADINKFTTKVYFQGFAPNSFDIHNSQPNDAKTGLMYTASVKLLNNAEALLCFDYPLVDGLSSNAYVGILVYDNNGALINEVGDIKIPITRNKLTVLRSNYLTKKYSPGVTIDPGYEGELNIVIPD